MNEEVEIDSKAALKEALILGIIVFLVGWPFGCWGSEKDPMHLADNGYLDPIAREWHYYSTCRGIDREVIRMEGYIAVGELGHSVCDRCLSRYEDE